MEKLASLLHNAEHSPEAEPIQDASSLLETSGELSGIWAPSLSAASSTEEILTSPVVLPSSDKTSTNISENMPEKEDAISESVEHESITSVTRTIPLAFAESKTGVEFIKPTISGVDMGILPENNRSVKNTKNQFVAIVTCIIVAVVSVLFSLSKSYSINN